MKPSASSIKNKCVSPSNLDLDVPNNKSSANIKYLNTEGFKANFETSNTNLCSKKLDIQSHMNSSIRSNKCKIRVNNGRYIMKQSPLQSLAKASNMSNLRIFRPRVYSHINTNLDDRVVLKEYEVRTTVNSKHKGRKSVNKEDWNKLSTIEHSRENT